MACQNPAITILCEVNYLHETNCYFSFLRLFRSKKKGRTKFFVDLEFYGWNTFSLYLAFTRQPEHLTSEGWKFKAQNFNDSFILLVTFLFPNFILRSHDALSKNVHFFDSPIWFALYNDVSSNALKIIFLAEFFKSISFSHQNAFRIFLAASTFWSIE